MKKEKLKTSDTKIHELTHDTVPASVGLLKEVRSELRADIRSVDHKVESLRSKLDAVEYSLTAKIDQVHHGLNSKIDQVHHGLNSKIDQVHHDLNSKIEQVLVSVHRSQVLMEEQRGENRIVLDGIKSLTERHDRMENDFGELRGTVKALSLGAKR